MNFKISNSFSSFSEINKKILGGLLSAYELSNNKLFLYKAKELGEMMIDGFISNNFPYSYYNLYTHKGIIRKELRYITRYGYIYGQDYYLLSELGSFQLELNALSYHTDSNIYDNIKGNVLNKLYSLYSGLIPNQIYKDGTNNGIFSINEHTGKFYEYLIKEYIQKGSNDKAIKETIIKFINDVIEKLVQQDVSGLYYLGILKKFEIIPQMDHYACFFPGMLVIAANKIEIPNSERIMTIAKELAFTCHLMYEQSNSGLAPNKIYIEYGFQYF